jgi:protein SCO1
LKIIKTDLKLYIYIAFFLFPITLLAQFSDLPPELRDIGIEERLGERVPLDITFTNESGQQVTLEDFFQSGKPVIITPIYYECPMLCNLILNGLTDGMKTLSWQPGNQFEVITFSIDPNEGHELAAMKKEGYIKLLDKPNAAYGWHFLTTDQQNIDRLTDALGFKFRWSDQAQEFLHGSAIMFISPNGQITRYLYGIDYPQISLRNALFDAAEGKIGTVIDKVVLYCYTYDPDSRSYVASAVNIMKLGGLVTLMGLSIFLGLLWFRKNTSKTINV